MNYCKIKKNQISISLPESFGRLEKVILADALDHGAFGEGRGTSVDEKNGNHRHIVVTFPTKTDQNTVQAFAEKTDDAIEELVKEEASHLKE